jgi:hypothetical protein
MISAAMLGTSTFAWFTMSREVEVTGIKMTASVPEDLQISPGYTLTMKGNNAYAINGTESFLTQLVDSTTTNSFEGKTAKAPLANDTQMWSNVLQLDHYYALGKIIPASSSKGLNLFFTPEANDEGRGVQYDASFYQVTDGLTESGTYMTALHALSKNENLSSGTWSSGTGYSAAANYSITNSDGYYVDIPVWIRSSSTSNVQLKVKAQTNWNTNAHIGDADVELYKAVRAVVIPDSSTNGSGTAGLIDVKDASGAVSRYGGPSIINYYGRGGFNSGAVKENAAANLNGGYDSRNSGTLPTWADVYEDVTMYDGDDPVVTIPARTSDAAQYGEGVKVWIRVWLEGEDPECWNKNAAQDFTIDVSFEKIV